MKPPPFPELSGSALQETCHILVLAMTPVYLYFNSYFIMENVGI